MTTSFKLHNDLHERENDLIAVLHIASPKFLMFEESFRIIQKWQICSEAYCKVSIISHLTLSAVFEMIVEKNTVMMHLLISWSIVVVIFGNNGQLLFHKKEKV